MTKHLEQALKDHSSFADRHIGPDSAEVETMLGALEYGSLEKLVDTAIPQSIRLKDVFQLPEALSEPDATEKLKHLARKNKIYRSLIGMGYHDCVVPAVIQRNILENPGWYTQYTPYQSEISQGRLEALLNFQSMVADLSGLPIANASLLDEASAAAEAMTLSFNVKKRSASNVFYVSEGCHPQTIAVLKTRARPLNIEIKVGRPEDLDVSTAPFGLLLQYPNTDGSVHDYTDLIAKAHENNTLVTVAADLLSLTLLKSPGEMGADVAVGSTQRFGVPMGYGGPHAAYFATVEKHKRKIPGRIIGVSKDSHGRPAYRMALQTREQHIRRDKATSNICTSQVLLAIMSSMYAVYHGPEGLKRIAEKVHGHTAVLATGLQKLGYDVGGGSVFDTLRVSLGDKSLAAIQKNADAKGYNLRALDDKTVGVALDEKTNLSEIETLLDIFDLRESRSFSAKDLVGEAEERIEPEVRRQTSYLQAPVFQKYHSETELLRYIKKLESRDLSLTQSMIPLGSCTMKLNATAELYPVSWPEFGALHPFAPREQAEGYQELFRELEGQLAACTGFDAVSLQPNSGAQGEFAGLLVIRQYHESRGEQHRNVCLIPKSAHGTNPASAVMAGMKVVGVECDEAGNIEVDDLEKKAAEHADNLAALMVTYPSTHGVFEEDISQICAAIHKNGGQVYMDGANMNAQIGLCKPAEYGPDVCHLNLHKTFCIPHGGGGPGAGPIAAKAHLAPYMPNHPVHETGGEQSCGTVAAAPWGSPSILPISLMYIWMMGAKGLTRATETAILNANYMAKRLDPHFPVLYRGQAGLVAHECIVDIRHLKNKAGIEVEDVAKRLMDYGFHAPTISFPVPGTMMIEPTESESLEEIDRFCDAMIAIREEIREIEEGRADSTDNVLKNAPHTAAMTTAEQWEHSYSRQKAAYPAEWIHEHKFWPSVSRIDNVYGDRNLVCTCDSVEAYEAGQNA